MRKSIVGILLGMVFLCGMLPSVWGVDIGISPPDVMLQLDAGETYQGQILVFGADTDQVNFTSYLMDWSLSTSGDYQFLPMGTLKRSAAPWLSYAPKMFSLPSNRVQQVNYTIRVPQNASGSYWGALMFGTVAAPGTGRERLNIAMAGRIAYIVRITVNGPANPAAGCDIEHFKAGWDSRQSRINAVLRVKNNGISFARFKGRLEITDSQGKKVGSIPFQEGLLLPDYSREFRLAATGPHLSPGIYVGLAIADFGAKSLKAAQLTFEVKS